jgi:hypothetical protein
MYVFVKNANEQDQKMTNGAYHTKHNSGSCAESSRVNGQNEVISNFIAAHLS